jgi:dihydrodipicolinate synthase/N-acetylneuraminate lyase
VKTTPVTPDDLSRSVISVPPLALTADLKPDAKENRKILRHLHSGGVTSYLYGGNANFFSTPVSEYAACLDMLEEISPENAWTIPSIGADYGKALDQVRILKSRSFPTAMLLPMQAPVTPEGIATGVRRLSDALGKQLIVYVKFENYLTPALLQKLHDDGVVCSIKYAIERPDPRDDDFLRELVDRVGTKRLVSGIGERPVIDHFSHFGLKCFTSGSVCIAPRISIAFLDAVRKKDQARALSLWELFVPLENLRDAHSPIRVLHEAVRLAGIADTGPMMPYLSNLTDPVVCAEIASAASALLQANSTL